MYLGAIGQRAHSDPDGVALADGTTTLSWKELEREVTATVRGLRHGAASPNTRIGVTGENTVHTMISHVAGLLSGVGTVALSRKSTGQELAQRLADSNCGLLIAGPGSLDAVMDTPLRSTGIALRTVIVHGISSELLENKVGPPAKGRPTFVTWSDWLTTCDKTDKESVDLTTQRPHPLMVYTSGTTGRARATEVQWFSIGSDTSAEQYVAGIAQRSGFPPGPHLVVGPLQHNGPLTSVRHLLSGHTVIVLPRFDATELLAAVDRHRVTSMVLVPTHFSRLLALPDATRKRFKIGTLELVSHTGSACPAPVKRKMIDWFGPVLVEAYGGSELGTVCKITSKQWLERPGSVGQAVPPLTIAAYAGDRALPAGETGVLGVTLPEGRNVRYLGDDEKSRKAYLAPATVTLGDIGYVDDDGFAYITDRVADVVVSGGVNLYPAEAEKVLIRHESIHDVAVIGVPDADMGEALKALVVPKGAMPDPEELDAFCRRELESAKCPRSYEEVTELVRNDMGKLDKKVMRRPYWPDDRTIAG